LDYKDRQNKAEVKLKIHFSFITVPNHAVVQTAYFIVRGKYNCQQPEFIQEPSIVFKE